MSSSESDAQVSRLITFVAVVRIVYGVVAIFFPRIWPKVFRLSPDDPDARVWNAFLGSRDIAIGVHSLLAKDDPQRRADVILINQGCEVFDTCVVGQEIRQGRPFGMLTAAGILFNAVMHGIWIKVRLLQRG